MRFIAIITILLFFVVSNGYTQIKLFGIMKDPSNTPIEFATIRLINDSIAMEAISNSNGQFEINVQQGNYQLIITYIGKILKDSTLSIQSDLELNFELNISKDTLETVTISAMKNWMVKENNKTVILVENTPYYNGFSARDILQLIPGIVIDQNSIYKFGEGQILVSINGRVQKLTGSELIDFLKNIPSNLISKVEYINHTGAVNDATSTGTMINIIYKETQKPRSSLNSFLEHDQNKYAIQRLGVNYSYFSSKIETYIALNGRRGFEQIKEKRTLENALNSWKGEDNTKKQAEPFNANLHFNYKLNSKTNIGTQFYTNIYESPQTTTGLYEYPQQTNRNYQYNSQGRKVGHLNSYSVYLGHQFQPKLKARVEWDYIQSKQLDHRAVNTLRSSGSNEIFNENIFKHNNYSLNTRFDYTITNLNFNWGAKYSLNRIGNDLFSYNQNTSLIFDQQYNVREEIKAAFLNSNYSKNNWSVNIGLRLEQTDFTGDDQSNTDQYNYNFTKLFPSFSLSKKLKSSETLRFRYNYSLTRPKFAEISPFRKYYDDNAYTVGNPFLSPQFMHYFETSFSIKKNIDFSLYYALTQNGQAMVFFVDTINNLQVSQPQNFYTLHNIGGSVSGFHRINDRWSLLHFMYLYYNTSTFENNYAKIAEPFNGLALYYNTQLHYTYKNTFINISGHLDPPRKAIYFKAAGSYALNFEIDQKFKKLPMKLNLQVRDIFNSSPMIHQFRTNGIDQSYYLNESSRRVILRFTYFFKQGAHTRAHQSEYNKEAGRYKF